jgi:DNA-binding transcriptional MerR regulator
MSDMIEVTADVQAERAAEERQRAYDAQQFARMGQLKDGNGNPVTVEQILEAHARGEEMRRIAAADFKAAQLAREAEQRVQAAEKAERERVEAEARAAQFKQRKLADWLAGGLGTEQEFNRQWDAIRLNLFASGASADGGALSDEEYRRRKRAESTYH